MNPKVKEVFNIKDEAKIENLTCSEIFNCSELVKIPKFCPVKDLTGLREKLVLTLNIWINAEPYELRCTLIYGESGELENIFHIAKSIKETYNKTKELNHLNNVLKIIRNVNQMIYLERNPLRILQGTASILLDCSDFEYILIYPINFPDLSDRYLEFYSPKFTNNEQQRIRLREKILEVISLPGTKQLDFDRYFILNTEIDGKGFNVIILNLSHFGKSFGYLAIQSLFEISFLSEEIDLLVDLARDLAFAINFCLVENDKWKIKQELYEKERFYYALLQNLPGFVYRCRNDRYWTMEYLSDQFYKITGYLPEEVILNKYISFNDLIHPDHQERLWVKWQEVLHKKEVFQDEYPIIRKDKQIRWVFEQGRGVFNSSGKLEYLEGYIVDVTERKLIEEDLRSSERKYRALFESSQDAIFLMLGDTFVDCNYATLKLFECSRRDIIGNTPYKFSPEYQPNGELSYKKAMNYIRRAFNGEVLRFEWTHKTLKGRLFECEVTLNRFFIGSTPYLVAIVRDISEIKLKNKKLSELVQALHSIGEVVTVTDVNNNIVFVNKTFEDVYGYSANEVIGKHISFLRADDFEPSLLESLVEEIKEKGVWRGELLNRKKDGSVFPLQLTASPMKDEKGMIYGFIGVAVDLTEFKKLQKELVLSTQKLNEILNSFEVAILIFNTQNICTEIYGKWERKWKHSKKEIISKNPIEIFGEPTGSLHIEFFKKCILDLSTYVFEWYFDEGNIKYFYQSKVLPYFDNSDKLVGILNIIQDITHFKKIEEQFKKFHTIIDQSPISIIIFDSQATVSYVNQQTNNILGYSKHKLIGKNLDFFKSIFTNEEFYKNFVLFFEEAKIWNEELSIFNKNGDIIWLSCSGFPIFDPNTSKLICYAIFFEDITTKRNLLTKLTEAKEKAEELNALKNYLMMYFSHEFRTPLNGILGYAQLLMLEQQDDEIKEIAEKIYLSGQRLLCTMTLLFDYSKIKTGLLKIHTSSFDFVDLVKEITFLYSKYNVEKNIDFLLEFESESLTIISDESMVRTIVANLISNAFKFTEEGKIFVSVKSKFLEGKQWVELSVIDTGIGIAKENIDLIWEEFFQVSQGLSRRYEGSGIGLSITKKYVELLGGQIMVESEPNVGSKFTVLLPIEVK
ncbi:MAG: PAS domain-containing sensor histidine kinase [Candidatus Kapaibacteriales bacterium]